MLARNDSAQHPCIPFQLAEQLYHSALSRLSHIRIRSDSPSLSNSLFASSSYAYFLDRLDASTRFPLASLVRLARRSVSRLSSAPSAAISPTWSVVGLLSRLKEEVGKLFGYPSSLGDDDGGTNQAENAKEGVIKAVKMLEEAGRKGKMDAFGVLGDLWLVSSMWFASSGCFEVAVIDRFSYLAVGSIWS
jgi:hypothetical protein